MVRAVLLLLVTTVAQIICPAAQADEMGKGFVILKSSKSASDQLAEIREVRSFETFPTLSRFTTADGSTVELKGAASAIFIPDPNTTQDARSLLSFVKELRGRFPHLDVKLGEIAKIAEMRSGQLRPLPSVDDAATQETLTVVLLDGTRFESVRLVDSGLDSIKVSDAVGIHAVFYETVDLEKSTLPQQVAAQVRSFNNPHILFKRAQELLNTREGTDAARAFGLLEKAANQNHRKAQFVLGDLYHKGEVVSANLEMARQWTKKAADNGLPEAIAAMAVSYSSSPDEEKVWTDKALQQPAGAMILEKARETKAEPQESGPTSSAVSSTSKATGEPAQTPSLSPTPAHEATSSATTSAPMPSGAGAADRPSFRGISPGMTFPQIVEVVKRQPLKFQFTPDKDDQVSGFVWLQPDIEQIDRRTDLKDFWYVAVAKDGTKYEWENIAVEMYEGKAMDVSFGTPSRNASFLESITLPWATMMLGLLTEKYGKPDVLNQQPAEVSVLELSSGFVRIIAQWIRGDYEITLGVGEYQAEYYSRITYTYRPLAERKKQDQQAVTPNL